MIEHYLQMNDISLSERDIMQDKDTSVLNKTFSNTDFNFSDLVGKKNYLQIKIEPLDCHIKVHSKSIKKIFTYISNNHGDLEDNYLDYITCLIGGARDELDREQLLPTSENPNNQNNQNLLEPSYYELLNRTKIYYIDISKSNLNKKINKCITLKKNSLDKIFSFLNVNIFDMCDYIEVNILFYQRKDSFEQRFLLNTKLIGKLNQSNDDINKGFSGHRKFPLNIEKPQKCNINEIHLLDNYFNNVWNAIEKEVLIDENLAQKPEEKNKIIKKKNNNNNNNNIDLPNSTNINNSRLKNKNKNGEIKDESPCDENLCGKTCIIF